MINELIISRGLYNPSLFIIVCLSTFAVFLGLYFHLYFYVVYSSEKINNIQLKWRRKGVAGTVGLTIEMDAGVWGSWLCLGKV